MMDIMKRLMLMILPAALLAAGCSADDPDKDGDNGSNLTDPQLKWSDTSCAAVLGAENVFPTLENAFGVPVTYSSSNTDVAVTGTDGSIELKGAGATMISATSSATKVYASATVSYTLTVQSSDDDGAGTFSYPSSGDPASDDDISTTKFTRKITVAFSKSGDAVVTGDRDGYATIDGNKVTVNNTGSESIVYVLTGAADNGFFKLYSTKKQAIHLKNVSITNPEGAAINNQSKKRTFVYVDGENKLADGKDAAYTVENEEDMKGVFFSEAQLIFSGDGSLSINAENAQGKAGISTDDYLRFMSSPSITVSCGSGAGHGIRGKDYVQITSGTLDISTAAAMKKAVNSSDYVLVEGGNTTINVTGGVDWDDEDQEYTGSAGIKADNYFAMTDGIVTITNSGDGGKGIRAGSYDFDAENHTLSDSYISGGTLNISVHGSEVNDVSPKGVKIGWVTKSGTGDRAKVTGYAGNMKVSGGKITVTSAKSEGFEVKGDLVITGGEMYVSSTGDDAINCQAEMNISGGYVYAYSSANDALDANHDMKISGGYVMAFCTAGNGPEVALDANTEEGYRLYIQDGAHVVAYPRLENNASMTQTCYTMKCTAGKWNALYGSSYICAFKVPAGISSVIVSAPSLTYGYSNVTVGTSDTYCEGTWALSSISGGTRQTLSAYNGNSGSRPGGRM
mgnify:CR=1 FL=1